MLYFHVEKRSLVEVWFSKPVNIETTEYGTITSSHHFRKYTLAWHLNHILQHNIHIFKLKSLSQDYKYLNNILKHFPTWKCHIYFILVQCHASHNKNNNNGVLCVLIETKYHFTVIPYSTVKAQCSDYVHIACLVEFEMLAYCILPS